MTKSPWNLRRVVHLHRRAGFAATWSEIQRDVKDGPQASIDRLLSGKSRNQGVPPDFERISALLADSAVAAGDPARLKAWWVYRMLFGPDPLGERLTLMWHNHFATSNAKVDDLAAMRRQNELFRARPQAVRRIADRRGARSGAAAVAGCAGQSQGASQRESWPRTDGVVHARHRSLQRERREGRRSRPHGLDRCGGRNSAMWPRGTMAARRRSSARRAPGAATICCAFCSIIRRRPGVWPCAICEQFFGEGVLDAAEHRRLGRRSAPQQSPHRLGRRDGPAFARLLRGQEPGLPRRRSRRVRSSARCAAWRCSIRRRVRWRWRTGWRSWVWTCSIRPMSSAGRAVVRWINTRSVIGRANCAAALVGGSSAGLPNRWTRSALARRHQRGHDLEDVVAFYGELLLGAAPSPAYRERLHKALGAKVDADAGDRSPCCRVDFGFPGSAVRLATLRRSVADSDALCAVAAKPRWRFNPCFRVAISSAVRH